MMRLWIGPYDPAIIDLFPAPPTDHAAFFISGELRVGTYCTGAFTGTNVAGVSYRTEWEGRCVRFALQEAHDFIVPRLYVKFLGVIHSRRGDVPGLFGVPVDQFVVVG